MKHLILSTLLVLVAIACTKRPNCHTSLIGVDEMRIDSLTVEKTYIFQTECL